MRRNAWPTCAQGLVALLALMTSAAFATDCNVHLSNADVNYGSLFRGDLATGAPTVSLGKRQLTLTVMCQQPTAIGLRLDGTAAADQNSYLFGKQGVFNVRLGQATVDGHAVQLARVSDAASEATASVVMRPNERVIVLSDGARAKGEVFSAQVEIETRIAYAATHQREVTLMQGRAIFQLDTE